MPAALPAGSTFSKIRGWQFASYKENTESGFKGVKRKPVQVISLLWKAEKVKLEWLAGRMERGKEAGGRSDSAPNGTKEVDKRNPPG